MFPWVSSHCASVWGGFKESCVLGTFAIVCLMTGKVVSQHTTIEIMQNGTLRHLDVAANQPSYTNMQVAVTVTFTVAMIQVRTCLTCILIDSFPVTCISFENIYLLYLHFVYYGENSLQSCRFRNNVFRMLLENLHSTVKNTLYIFCS